LRHGREESVTPAELELAKNGIIRSQPGLKKLGYGTTIVVDAEGNAVY
jgi:hypothetical protein